MTNFLINMDLFGLAPMLLGWFVLHRVRPPADQGKMTTSFFGNIKYVICEQIIGILVILWAGQGNGRKGNTT